MLSHRHVNFCLFSEIICTLQIFAFQNFIFIWSSHKGDVLLKALCISRLTFCSLLPHTDKRQNNKPVLLSCCLFSLTSSSYSTTPKYSVTVWKNLLYIPTPSNHSSVKQLILKIQCCHLPCAGFCHCCLYGNNHNIKYVRKNHL